MNLWLVLPVKPLAEGKSRLSSVLNPQERIDLNRALMIHVLETAWASQLLRGMLVISRDPVALASARSYSAEPLPENGNGLNGALAQGRRAAMAKGADALLILPADLPLLTVTDLHLLVQQLQFHAVAIAPSQDGGTNALLLRPPDALPFHFGQNSFVQHANAAHQANFTLGIVRTPTLQTDIDLPQHLSLLPRDFISIRPQFKARNHESLRMISSPQA